MFIKLANKNNINVSRAIKVQIVNEDFDRESLWLQVAVFYLEEKRYL